MGLRRLLRADADFNNDTLLCQAPVAGTRNERIRVGHGRHHTRNSSCNDGIRTGSRFAMVRAWLERHEERRRTRILAGMR
jgi:hypothetical protein